MAIFKINLLDRNGSSHKTFEIDAKTDENAEYSSITIAELKKLLQSKYKINLDQKDFINPITNQPFEDDAVYQLKTNQRNSLQVVIKPKISLEAEPPELDHSPSTQKPYFLNLSHISPASLKLLGINHLSQEELKNVSSTQIDFSNYTFLSVPEVPLRELLGSPKENITLFIKIGDENVLATVNPGKVSDIKDAIKKQHPSIDRDKIEIRIDGELKKEDATVTVADIYSRITIDEPSDLPKLRR